MLLDQVHIGIVGSRRRNTRYDKEKIREKLLEYLHIYEANGQEIVLVSGGCPEGGDAFAEELAKELGLSIIIHFPRRRSIDLEKNPKWEFGRIAKERNTLIARDSDVLIARVAEDRKGGPEDTVKKYNKMSKAFLELV